MGNAGTVGFVGRGVFAVLLAGSTGCVDFAFFLDGFLGGTPFRLRSHEGTAGWSLDFFVTAFEWHEGK
jgi:hypothetical protein